MAAWPTKTKLEETLTNSTLPDPFFLFDFVWIFNKNQGKSKSNHRVKKLFKSKSNLWIFWIWFFQIQYTAPGIFRSFRRSIRNWSKATTIYWPISSPRFGRLAFRIRNSTHLITLNMKKNQIVSTALKIVFDRTVDQLILHEMVQDGNSNSAFSKWRYAY